MKTITIYRSLVTSFLFVIVLLAGGLFAMTVVGARDAVESFSSSAMGQATEEVETRLARFFDPAQDLLPMMKAWGESGRLAFSDVEDFNRFFLPVMREHPHITSIILADDTGRELLLLKLPDQWLNRSMHVDERGDMAEWRTRATFDEAPTIEHRRKEGYDPRKRPWYEGARDTPSWTAPYTFATTKDAGITASISFRAPDGRPWVVGFDLLLRDISRYTAALSPSPNGYGFVSTDDGRVLGLPGLPRFRDPDVLKTALLKTPAELGVPTADDFPASGEPHRFERDGEPWWGSRRWFALDDRRGLGVAVVIPESDLLGGAHLQRVVITLMTALAALFAAFYAMRLARRYSAPIRALAKQSMRIRDGDLEGGRPIETRLTEVQVLAETHDEMRSSLRTLLKLERDIAIARDIQQQTIPHALPALPGYEIAAWTFPADETGGDTFDAFDRKGGALFLLADATGHGIGPALSVTQVRSMLRVAARAGQPIEEIVAHMNEQLCLDLDSGRFVTAWLGQLDPVAHTLTAVSAGQSPLLHYHASSGTVDVLGSDAPPLGVVEGLPVTMPPARALEPGDLFAVISDGIYESRVVDGDEFGSERVVEHLIRHADRPPAEILDTLRAAALEYGPQDDDQTAILIKRL